MLMQHFGKFLFLLLCITLFFVFFSSVKDRVLIRSCFISAYLRAHTAMMSLDKRTNWSSAIGSDQNFMLSTCCSTAAEGCRLVSNASHLGCLKSLTFKEVISAVILLFFKDPILLRCSYLLAIGKKMQP